MEIHVFPRCSDKAFDTSDSFVEILTCTLYYGPDWWIEDRTDGLTDGLTDSYKVLGQYQTDKYKIFCLKKMSENWIGTTYLGRENIVNISRKVFRNITRIPDGDMEWNTFAN